MPPGMQFIHNDLGQRQGGDVVEVKLTSGANVRLMDASNFNAYRNGRPHRFVGGLARQTPIRLQIPNSGHWHVAIDMQGLRGRTSAQVQVIPGSALRPLPPIQQNRAMLKDIAENAAEATGGADADREYDVFISHATEDKQEVVRPLAHALQENGLDVWYDEFELRIGDVLAAAVVGRAQDDQFSVGSRKLTARHQLPGEPQPTAKQAAVACQRREQVRGGDAEPEPSDQKVDLTDLVSRSRSNPSRRRDRLGQSTGF
jgi:Domain of unknown function (DUF1883)/TIR domain